MDVEALLSQLPSRATRYHCINLNGLVIRDKELVCHGRGGHAIVYKGSLRHTGTRVAVKTAIRGSTTDEDMIKKVFKEVHAWSKFKHENVLPLIGITTDFDFTVSIVSRWMVLGNARTYVQNPAIDPRPLVVGIARGLSYLHKHPKGSIVHGDLKGQNVLISDDGHALIADFGLTYLENSSFSFASNLTQGGGTISWMSPELVECWYNGELETKMTVESDVWAFGMTTLELFTRLDPFHPLTKHMKIATKIRQGLPPRPSGEVTYHRMTDNWWDICLRCWARQPSSRPPIAQVLGDIELMVPSPSPHISTGVDSSSVTNPDMQVLTSLATTYTQLNLNGSVRRDQLVRSRSGSNVFEVYKGTTLSTGTRVAIKKVLTTVQWGNSWKQDVLQRVYEWSNLEHSNILPPLGMSTDFDCTISIVSKWMESGNAHCYVQDSAIDPRPLIAGIARGLCYLHIHLSRPLVHGAIKGSNVLIEKGNALISDCDYSHLVPSFPEFGSYHWMSPEIITSKQQISTESDVWAFGMTVLELFTRNVPFHGLGDRAKVEHRILHGLLPDRPHGEITLHRMTDKWWKICLDCWQHDPSVRPSMLQILNEIENTEKHECNSPLVEANHAEFNQSDITSTLVGDTSSRTSYTTAVGEATATNTASILSKLEESQSSTAVSYSALCLTFVLNNEPGSFQYVQLNDLTADNFIIIVIGPAGSGKSAFISKATGINDGVGHELTPRTNEMRAIKCMEGEFANMVLVDTPGLDDVKKASQQMPKQILDKIHRKEISPACIFYLHRITDNRMSGAPLRDFHTFKGLCRNGAISQVTLVTTMWDEVEEETGKERLEELRNDYWTDILTGRPTTFRYRNTPESAKELLREVAKTRPVHHIGRTSNMNTEPTIRKDKERIDKAIRNIKKPRLHSSSRFDSIRKRFRFNS